MNPYQVLGVMGNATLKEIKAAYRKLSKGHHPDTGGDREQFERIKLAFEVLKDPDRRARFDKTGRVDKSPVTEERVRDLVVNAVRGMINGPKSGIMDNPAWADVKTKVLQSIKSGQIEIQNNMYETQRKLERIERLLERFKSKTDQDPVGEALMAEKKICENEMKSHEDAMEMSHAVEHIFLQYDYEVGPGPEGQFSPGPPLRRGTMLLGNSGSGFTTRR